MVGSGGVLYASGMMRLKMIAMALIAAGMSALGALGAFGQEGAQPEGAKPAQPGAVPAVPGPVLDQPEEKKQNPENTVDWGPRWGVWRGEIQLPEGQALSFNFVIDFARDGAGEPVWTLELRNGPESIPATIVSEYPKVTMTFAGTEARIESVLDEASTGLAGEYVYARTNGEGEEIEYRLPFRAWNSDGRRFAWLDPEWTPGDAIAGRWSLHFDEREGPAVAELVTLPDGMNVLGTVMTPTGDDGQLAGTFEKGRLRLSRFTGGSGLLYDATLEADGTLIGTYRSLGHHAEGFTGTADGEAALPDLFELTSWRDEVGLADLTFKNYEGSEVNLGELAPDGSPRLIYVMGTWCHNCADATRYLSELHERYSGAGLAVVGLAFETPKEFEEQAANVRAYVQHRAVPFPILVAGQRDKAAATEALGALDKVRAFPTIAFVSKDGEVVAVHQGFVGPAAPGRHAELRSAFESRIESMLE